MSTPQAAQSMADTRLDQLCINTISTISMDAVLQAKSVHPGTPMALAPLVYTLWNRVMRFDPQGPISPNGESVLPEVVTARIAIEQASTLGWERYVGDSGVVIGTKTFGASAPLNELQRKFGFESDRVVATAKALLGRQ